ncbi:MAG: dipeptide/oligopeptide/nickel ABC transporter ATP-binding protein [Lachnospiraceae bacterium]|nr:dipeptide/oligopeptide/nickel ABC transporter ATP-binding protein [Lachnospiraceae bacterium]
METVLQIKDLSKVFHQGKNEFYGVDHISFELMKNQILGIVGESGSGKSTVAKLITRLIDASSGTIILEGQDITALKGSRLREVYSKIQMVFQTPMSSFDPRRTLGDGIGESLRNKKIPKSQISKRVEELLLQCGLTAEFAQRYPHEVSGGECQRAAIARALANDPEILILDEATSALDVTVQKQILDLLQELQKKRGLSYLFICHNLALVQEFCDEIIVMYDGKIVESGKTDEVIGHPQAEYTKRLIEAIF